MQRRNKSHQEIFISQTRSDRAHLAGTGCHHRIVWRVRYFDTIDVWPLLALQAAALSCSSLCKCNALWCTVAGVAKEGAAVTLLRLVLNMAVRNETTYFLLFARYVPNVAKRSIIYEISVWRSILRTDRPATSDRRPTNDLTFGKIQMAISPWQCVFGWRLVHVCHNIVFFSFCIQS